MFTTCWTPLTSNPLAATSVATKTEHKPLVKSFKAASRSPCVLPPCKDAVATPSAFNISATSSAFALRSTNTMDIGGALPCATDSIFSSTSIRHNRSIFATSFGTFSKLCATFEVGAETVPTFTFTGFTKYSPAKTSTSGGIVALNNNVCLGFGVAFKISKICCSKPISNIRSASSKTRNDARRKLVLFWCM